MRRIYEAANSLEAHMVVHMLNHAGIEAHIQGEHLQSGAGELPLGGLVGVAVADDDASAALKVIKEWEAQTPPPDRSTQQAATRGFYGPLLAFLVGSLFGAGIVWSVHHGPETTTGTDWNDDGTLDERVYYNGSTLDRIEADRNFDGKVDVIERYNLDGWIQSIDADEDFDGRLETKTTYDKRDPFEARIDADGDSEPDYLIHYKYGVADTFEYLNSSGVVVKRTHFRGPKLERAELDLDADGVWERSYQFDRYDEPVDVRTSN